MKLVLLGDPVERSRSPAIQTAALAAAGIDGSYEAQRVDATGMVIAVDEIRYGRLHGANVTMPHKHLAFELADRVAEGALRSGAVNTLVRDRGEVWGHNTDVDGIRAVWAEKGLPDGAPVLILGSGGAAAAAVVALAEHTIMVTARRPNAAASLLTRTRIDGAVQPWGTAVDGAVIVNATPLGMNGEAIPDGVLDGAAGFFDLAYGTDEAPSVARARTLGIPVTDGRDMLLAQAAVSFEIWTGVKAPIDVMRTAF
ncbi:MAG: shikimate dehydrogenase [Actinomycetota bacterium]|nr:shikimate dehydrogenase [Actinomycetota bacterium]